MQIIIYVLDADASKKKLKFFNFICFFNQSLILYKISNEKKLYSSVLRGFTLNSFFMYNDKNWTFHGSCDMQLWKQEGKNKRKERNSLISDGNFVPH